MQFKTENIMNPKKTEFVNGNADRLLTLIAVLLGTTKNNKANFNEDLKVDEAFIFGNYGTSVGLISKWNLNHLNDPREGTIAGIILLHCKFHKGYLYRHISRAFSPYGNRHIPIINILFLYNFDLRKSSKTTLAENFLNDTF